ncbi:Pet127-domain-containing protein, partial [Tilletiopsis washingtonensis]
KWQQARGGKLESSKVEVKPVKPLREMQVPRLAHNLSRVLFNPGVHWLREPRTGIYNFDPALRHIADVDLFDYDSLPPYVTSSADPELAKITKRESARYSGSTSSLTGALSQIYFHLSHWRRPDFSGFSEGFAGQTRDFGAGARLPASIRLRKTSAEGEAPRYAVDQDKSASGEAENSNYILTQLGKALENFFTKSPEEYAKHLRVNSHKLTPEERSRPEAYHYARARNLVMRSQLDCSDERLPRRTFDLKTRAVAAVRQDRANWVEAGGYAIRQLDGAHESFEREMYDLVRSAFLKYYFQARIGHMDGIFLAYHSTSSIFGFQYVPLEDMARRLFGDTDMAEQAFRLSVAMLEEILDAATDFFPDEPLKITLDTSPGPRSLMDVFSASDADAPAAEPSVSAPRTIVQLQVLLDRYLDGQLVQGPVDFSAAAGRRVDARSDDEPSRRARAELPPVQWDVEWAISPCASLSEADIRENLAKVRARQSIFNELSLPNIDSLNARDEERLEELASNPEALARFKAERAAGTAAGMPTAPGQTSEAKP